MLGLAIDTSGPYLGLMLHNETSCLQSIQHTQSRDHCASLIPQIQTLLNSQQKTLADVDQWSVVAGPGSFTGLRVGVVTVKMLAMTSHKPIVSVNNFNRLAYAQDHDPAQKIGLIWPAQKGYAYVSVQQNTHEVVKPCFLPWNEIPWDKADQWRYPEWVELPHALPEQTQRVSFKTLTTQAWHKTIKQSTQQHDANSLEPWYIQPSYAKKPTAK